MGSDVAPRDRCTFIRKLLQERHVCSAPLRTDVPRLPTTLPLHNNYPARNNLGLERTTEQKLLPVEATMFVPPPAVDNCRFHFGKGSQKCAREEQTLRERCEIADGHEKR